MDSGIYCYTNKINDKKYIGQSQTLSKRLSRHDFNFRCKSWKETSPRENRPLWNAVHKYGIENFELVILEYCSPDVLDEREIYYIDNLGSHFSVWGYNLSLGGGTSRGVKHTRKSRKNMSIAHTGKILSEEQKDKISKNNQGKRKQSTSNYIGVHRIVHGDFIYWVVDVKRKKKRLFTGSFSSEVCAAVYYDCCIISLGLDNPLNFSENERNKILESDEWKYVKNYGKKRKNKHSSSGFLGVIKIIKNSLVYWKCQISSVYIGTYKEEKDAALAYNEYVIANNLPYNLNEIKENHE